MMKGYKLDPQGIEDMILYHLAQIEYHEDLIKKIKRMRDYESKPAASKKQKMQGVEIKQVFVDETHNMTDHEAAEERKKYFP